MHCSGLRAEIARQRELDEEITIRQKILVVEDNKDCRELLVIQLRCLGYKIIETDSGAKALEKAVSEVPDLIIMDIGLPGIDGIRATRWLKEDLRTKHIPIIVHTAWQEEACRKRALEAGAAEVLTKPVPAKVFQEIVRRFLQTNSQTWQAVSTNIV